MSIFLDRGRLLNFIVARISGAKLITAQGGDAENELEKIQGKMIIEANGATFLALGDGEIASKHFELAKEIGNMVNLGKKLN